MLKRDLHRTGIVVMVWVVVLLTACDRSGSEPPPQSLSAPGASIPQDTRQTTQEDAQLLAAIPVGDFVLLVREIDVKRDSGMIVGTVDLIPVTMNGTLINQGKRCYVAGSYFPIGFSSGSVAIALNVKNRGIKQVVLFSRDRNTFQEFDTFLPYVAQVAVWKNQLVYSTEDPQAAVVMIETDTGAVHKFPTKDDGLINALMVTTEKGVYAQDSNSKKYFLVTKEGLIEAEPEGADRLEPKSLELEDFKDSGLLEKYREVLANLDEGGHSDQSR